MEIQKLELQLETLPSKIRDVALEVAKKENILDNAKLSYDVVFGMTLTGSKASSATDRKSMAIVGSQAEAEKVIAAKYNLEKEKASLKYLENQYISCRKLASMESDRLKVNVSGF